MKAISQLSGLGMPTFGTKACGAPGALWKWLPPTTGASTGLPFSSMEKPSASPDLTGPGPWRLGQTRHGRGVAAVFLPKVELHTHIASRTDQFPMYVVGEAQGFSLDGNGKPVLEPAVGGSHFHYAPGAPHAFVPRVGIAKPDKWEIVFIAITPRNLKEDTHRVSDEVRVLYRQVVGQDAPLGV